jgi:hypothetical protein
LKGLEDEPIGCHDFMFKSILAFSSIVLPAKSVVALIADTPAKSAAVYTSITSVKEIVLTSVPFHTLYVSFDAYNGEKHTLKRVSARTKESKMFFIC